MGFPLRIVHVTEIERAAADKAELERALRQERGNVAELAAAVDEIRRDLLTDIQAALKAELDRWIAHREPGMPGVRERFRREGFVAGLQHAHGGITRMIFPQGLAPEPPPSVEEIREAIARNARAVNTAREESA